MSDDVKYTYRITYRAPHRPYPLTEDFGTMYAATVRWNDMCDDPYVSPSSFEEIRTLARGGRKIQITTGNLSWDKP